MATDRQFASNTKFATSRTKIPMLPQRADIQSLRALAVGLVVVSHAGMPWLRGGYVGVDVFFVLSGYLISGLILREIDTNGNFDPWRFYARRLKRLLPALLFVMLSTSAVAWITLAPQRQISDATAGQAASLWLSNFYFATRTINYFSGGEQNNLFLHTWSLSVEEQFYLVWPLIVLFLYGAWSWQGSPKSYRRLAIGYCLVAAGSLLLATYLAQHQVDDGFYLMPSRAWEFSLGALTYLLRRSCEVGRIEWLGKLRGHSVLNIIGWIAILLAAAIYSDTLRYPGLWALLPCIGAALILLDAPEIQHQSVMSRFVLRQPHMQFIGNISYSLYLWHWPVFVLGIAIFGGSPTAYFSLILLSVILSSTTYYALELPIHRAPIQNRAKILLLSGVAMALGFFMMATWSLEAENLMKGPEQAKIGVSRFDLPEINSQACDTWYHDAEVLPCVRGPAHAAHTVVMFGDSTLAQWFPAISKIFLHKQIWRIVVLTKSACPASQVSYYYSRIKSTYGMCDLWRQRAIDHIVQLQPDLIIMGSRDYGFSSEQWVTGTRAVLKRLSPATQSVFIISPTPDLGFDGPDCLSKEVNIPYWMPHRGRCETMINPYANSRAHEALEEATQYYPNVTVMHLDHLICPDRVCRARMGARIIFRDNQHLTASFVESLAPEIQTLLLNPNKRSKQ